MLGITKRTAIILLAFLITARGQTLYEIYNEGGVANQSGPALTDHGPQFKLNGKPFHILGGSIQYFRVPPEYWRDRIRKLKAIGANTIETVTPWNLHEPHPGRFEFEGKLNLRYVPWNLHEEHHGQFDFTGRLNIRQFLQIAQEEDMFVILRPGPYICAEWEFGGFPSWLLRNTSIKVRTSDPIYTSAIQSYYEKLIPQVVDLQFTKGGSIIMVQVENEYGSFTTDDPDYLNFLKNLLEQQGIIELFVNSDSCSTDQCREQGTVPGLLMTANFQNEADKWLDQLARLQPGSPLMVMEFWTGWFDYWGGRHNVVNVDTYVSYLNAILARNASLSMYMFTGGTSFGYMSGANTEVQLAYLPIVSSYDYDAPLTEWGDYTPKYNATKQIFEDFSRGQLWDVPLPGPPAEAVKRDYGSLNIEQYLNFDDLLSLLTPQMSQTILPMELLDLYNNSGQSFGFIVYQTSITVGSAGSTLVINGRVRDYAKIYVDNVLVGTFNWYSLKPTLTLDGTLAGTRDLKIIVENSGRVNFGSPVDFTYDNMCKGIKDSITLDSTTLANWAIYSLDFNQNYINGLSGAPWKTFSAPADATYPALLATTLSINEPPQDTFISTQGWSKGIVIVNNFVLSRYWDIGPQKTLYLPAPLLVQGDNKIYFFELGTGNSSVYLTDTPDLGPPVEHSSFTSFTNSIQAMLTMIFHP